MAMVQSSWFAPIVWLPCAVLRFVPATLHHAPIDHPRDMSEATSALAARRFHEQMILRSALRSSSAQRALISTISPTRNDDMANQKSRSVKTSKQPWEHLEKTAKVSKTLDWKIRNSSWGWPPAFWCFGRTSQALPGPPVRYETVAKVTNSELTCQTAKGARRYTGTDSNPYLPKSLCRSNARWVFGRRVPTSHLC